MRRRGRVLAVATVLLAGACGGDSSGGAGVDPVATAEDPAVVLANSQYPELAVDGLRSKHLLDTGRHLTHVLSFVDGVRMDEKAAIAALRYFEHLRHEVGLEVQGESSTLTYNVRPRNYPQRYVMIVPDGAPLPRWAGRRDAGQSFSASRPVNVDHAVTLIVVAEKPFPVGAPFDTMSVGTQLDWVFHSGACARSASITTDEAAAYRYGANIHNLGEGVICNAEARQLVARQLKMPASAVADLAAANRVSRAPQRGPSLAEPPFDERRYDALPDLPPIFTLL